VCGTGLAGAALLAAPFVRAASAQPIRILAAGTAGGSADIVARLLADGMSRELGQPSYVEPKPGAGGVLAVNELLQAPHDGLTLVVAVNSLVSEIPNIVKLRIDMARSLSPLAELARSGLVLVASPSFPAADVPALVAHAKAHPARSTTRRIPPARCRTCWPAAQQGGGHRPEPRRLQRLDGRAGRRDRRPRAADVRRPADLAAADPREPHPAAAP
jgi:hypothetical protein